MRLETQIAQTTLETMPSKFTSKFFCKEARRYGLHDSWINNGNANKFLSENCTKVKERTWVKSKKSEPILERGQMITDAINLLKSEGYKILKPVKDWQEV
jgi:hypothetical protein